MQTSNLLLHIYCFSQCCKSFSISPWNVGWRGKTSTKQFVVWRILSSKKNSSHCRACNMSLSLSRSGLGLSVHLSIIWFSSVLNKFFIMVVFSFIKASLGPIPFQSIWVHFNQFESISINLSPFQSIWVHFNQVRFHFNGSDSISINWVPSHKSQFGLTWIPAQQVQQQFESI